MREVHCDEGDRVSPGAPLVRLEVPDLAARLAQKRAEVRQAEARLHLLEEEVAEQRRRVGAGRSSGGTGRLSTWCEPARVLAADLAGLDQRIAQAQAEVEAAAAALSRARSLGVRNAAPRGAGRRRPSGGTAPPRRRSPRPAPTDRPARPRGSPRPGWNSTAASAS